MIVKIFETYVYLRMLGLFSKKVHCSLRKLALPWGTIVSSSLEKEFKLPQGII